jgi:MFS family permease
MWGFAALDRMLISHLFPFIAVDFNLDFTKMGVLMSCMTAGCVFMYYVSGTLADKYGRKRIILPSVLIFSIGSFLTGFARNLGQLIGIRTVIGGAEGAYITAAIVHVSEESPPEQRGTNVGFLQMGMPLFSMFVAPLYASQIGTRFGWHWAFWLTIIPGLLLAWFAKSRIKESSQFIKAVQVEKNEFKWGQVLRERNVIFMILLSICWMVWLYILLSFGTMYFTSVRGFSAIATGGLLTGLGVGGSIGSVLVPTISDYIGRKPVLIGSMILSFITTAFVFLVPNSMVPVIWICLALSAFGVWGTAPIFMGVMTTESVPVEGSGKAYSVVTGTGELLGAMVGPIVLGIIADASGLQLSMWLGCFALIGVVIFSMCLRETAPRILAKRAQKAA